MTGRRASPGRCPGARRRRRRTGGTCAGRSRGCRLRARRAGARAASSAARARAARRCPGRRPSRPRAGRARAWPPRGPARVATRLTSRASPSPRRRSIRPSACRRSTSRTAPAWLRPSTWASEFTLWPLSQPLRATQRGGRAGGQPGRVLPGVLHALGERERRRRQQVLGAAVHRGVRVYARRIYRTIRRSGAQKGGACRVPSCTRRSTLSDLPGARLITTGGAAQ